jgi:hypothetical protein
MEIALNLVWLLLAAVIVRLWISFAPRKGASLRTQIGALAMLILFLLPVISVTDDLQAAQNLAEYDTYACLRRNSTVVSPHSIFPATAMLPVFMFTELSFLCFCSVAPGHLPVGTPNNPALAAIQNRPPPYSLILPLSTPAIS